MKKKRNQQRRPRTVEQLAFYIRKEWDNISLPKVQQLMSSDIDGLLLKKEGTLHINEHGQVAIHQFKMSQDFFF